MPGILLFTTVLWPSATRGAGAFANLGCEVHALYPRRHLLAQSVHIAHRHVYDPLRGRASLAAAIDQAKPDLVVPLDDRATRYLAGADCKTLVEASLGNPAVYSDLDSRSGFIATAQALGLRAPDTVAIGSQAELEPALQRLGLPAVMKSDRSWGGDGVVTVHSRDEALIAFARLSLPPSRLRSVARAMRRNDLHFLLDAIRRPAQSISLQRFVAGTSATTSLACWQGRVLAANHLDVVVADGTGPACVVRPVACAGMTAAAAALAQRYGLSGLHGLDFMRDADGHAHLIEINPRATPTSHLALGPGHDLVAALLSAALRETAPRPAVTDKKTIALFPQEWLRDPDSPHLVWGFHDVPWDDPGVLRGCLPAAKRKSSAISAFTTWKPSGFRLPRP